MEKRVVVVGAGGVGKSALTIQFILGKFTSQYDPTIEDSYRKQVEVDHKHLILDILDTAGQEEYASMRAAYMRGGDGFLCIYSITSTDSFDDMKEMHNTILRSKNCAFVPMVLCGNKIDLEVQREVPTEEGKSAAENFKCEFFETSAKTNINVEEAFLQVARAILAEVPPPEIPNPRSEKSGKRSQPCSLL